MAVIKYKDENGNIYELPLLVPMDGALSSESENGVQNKAIKAAIDEVNNAFNSVNTLLDELNGQVVRGQKVSKAIESKAAIKDAITNKGVNVPSNATLASYASYVEQINQGIIPTGNIQITAQTGTDVSAYETASVMAGAISEPVAVRGTVSNHQIDISPIVTYSKGWIDNGSKTGSSITVTASELASGNIEISAQTGTNVANYATASVKSGRVDRPTLHESWNTSHNRLTITANGYSESGWINGDTIVGQSKTYTPDDFGIKNVQCSPVVTQIKNKTSMTATNSTITVSKAGTYRCSWAAWSYANGSSGTNNYSTQLYKNGSAVGSSHYTYVYSGTGTFVFTETLTLAEGDVLVVRARTRSGTNYYTTAGMLCIEEQ